MTVLIIIDRAEENCFLFDNTFHLSKKVALSLAEPTLLVRYVPIRLPIQRRKSSVLSCHSKQRTTVKVFASIVY